MYSVSSCPGLTCTTSSVDRRFKLELISFLGLYVGLDGGGAEPRLVYWRQDCYTVSCIDFSRLAMQKKVTQLRNIRHCCAVSAFMMSILLVIIFEVISRVINSRQADGAAWPKTDTAAAKPLGLAGALACKQRSLETVLSTVSPFITCTAHMQSILFLPSYTCTLVGREGRSYPATRGE